MNIFKSLGVIALAGALLAAPVGARAECVVPESPSAVDSLLHMSAASGASIVLVDAMQAARGRVAVVAAALALAPAAYQVFKDYLSSAHAHVVVCPSERPNVAPLVIQNFVVGPSAVAPQAPAPHVDLDLMQKYLSQQRLVDFRERDSQVNLRALEALSHPRPALDAETVARILSRRLDETAK